MPKTGANVYKRKDGRWEGRYIKNRDSSNGKAIYGSVYGKTSTEVKQKLSTVATDTHSEKFHVNAVNKRNIAFADVAAQWLSVVSLRVKPSTYAGYTSMLELHILPSFGSCLVQKISSLDMSNFAKRKLEAGRTDGKGGLSAKTVRDILSIIKSIMDYALSEKIIENPFKMHYPKLQQQAIRVLSRKEQVALEAIITSDLNIHRIGVLLCLYTGLRVGEVCALRWQDISPKYDEVSVRQTLQRVKNLSNDGGKTKIIIDTPKSLRSIRTIPIPKFLTPYLRSLAKDNHVFFLATDDSGITEPRTMQNHFVKLVKAANIANANYHSLRHTFATRCIEAGVDVKSLSEMLGHANVNLTLNRYVHSSLEQKREGMNKLEQYIGT